MIFKNIAEKCIDIILPPRCAVSGHIVDSQGSLAPEVWAQMNFIGDPKCDKCGVPFEFSVDGKSECPACQSYPPVFHRCRSAVVYDDYSRNIILRFKHADQMHVVDSFMPWLMRAGAESLAEADMIVPVPLHRWRILRRRYNQSALLAQRLAKLTAKPYEPDVLQRVRATPIQGHLSGKQRHQNVKHAFALRKGAADLIDGKTVLLIDDVYTSGATIKECTKLLLKSGAGRVDVLTIARVVRPEYIL